MLPRAGNSLYDKPTHLLFTGIRNWRICRCYSVAQWGPARLARLHGCSFSTFPAHTGPPSVISGLVAKIAILARRLHPEQQPRPSIERPRTAQPRHDHFTSGSDLSGLHRSIHAGCPYPRNVQRGKYMHISMTASGAGRFSAIFLRTANYLRKTSCVKSKYGFQDTKEAVWKRTGRPTLCVKMAILSELNAPEPTINIHTGKEEPNYFIQP